jgi:predicted PurR-regulated permease PerM
MQWFVYRGREAARRHFVFRIAMILFSMIATTLAGTAMVVALTIGQDTLVPLVTAAATGFVAAIPVTWLVARQIAGRR